MNMINEYLSAIFGLQIISSVNADIIQIIVQFILLCSNIGS